MQVMMRWDAFEQMSTVMLAVSRIVLCDLRLLLYQLAELSDMQQDFLHEDPLVRHALHLGVLYECSLNLDGCGLRRYP